MGCRVDHEHAAPAAVDAGRDGGAVPDSADRARSLVADQAAAVVRRVGQPSRWVDRGGGRTRGLGGGGNEQGRRPPRSHRRSRSDHRVRDAREPLRLAHVGLSCQHRAHVAGNPRVATLVQPAADRLAGVGGGRVDRHRQLVHPAASTDRPAPRARDARVCVLQGVADLAALRRRRGSAASTDRICVAAQSTVGARPANATRVDRIIDSAAGSRRHLDGRGCPRRALHPDRGGLERRPDGGPGADGGIAARHAGDVVRLGRIRAVALRSRPARVDRRPARDDLQRSCPRQSLRDVRRHTRGPGVPRTSGAGLHLAAGRPRSRPGMGRVPWLPDRRADR